MSTTKDGSHESNPRERGGLNRRTLLKGALATAGAGVAAAVGVQAQVTGLMPGGGKVPFRRPMGSLDYLDRNQYISNMEIISHPLQGDQQGAGVASAQRTNWRARCALRDRGGATRSRKPRHWR